MSQGTALPANGTVNSVENMEVVTPVLAPTGETPAVSQPLDNFNYYKTLLSPREIIQFLQSDNVNDITIFLGSNGGAIPSIHPRRLKVEIQKIIPGHANIETLRLTRQGKLLFVTKDTETANQILDIQALGNIRVSPVLQPECITTRFLLHDIPTDVSCKEIAEDLKEAGIVCWEVRRFTKNLSGQISPTKTVLVTKLGTSLPNEVKIWYQRHKITLFVDRPRCCQKCWAYNHATKNCKKDKICRNCGAVHEGDCKDGAQACASCLGSHATGDKTCPKYIEELKIQEFKSKHHLTVTEARRKYKSEEGRVKYATVVSKQPKDCSHPTNTTSSKNLENTLSQMIEVLVSLKASIEKAREDQEENANRIITAVHCMMQGLQQNQIPVIHQVTPITEQSSSPTRKMQKKENVTNAQANQQIMRNQPFDPMNIAAQSINLQNSLESSSTMTQSSFILPPKGET